MNQSKKRGISLIELIVVISIVAVLIAVITPMIFDMRSTSKTATQSRCIQLWNQTYIDAYVAGSGISTISDWNTISNDLAAGVTVQVGNQAVTFACPKPVFVNEGDPTFVPGKGITAAP